MHMPWPPAGWGEVAKREMFQDYWDSGDPLLGELGGGRGWAGWLAGVSAPDVGAEAAARRTPQAQRLQEEEEAAAQQEPQVRWGLLGWGLPHSRSV
jgi:hypothetical protein